MTESAEPTAESPTANHDDLAHRPNRLYQALAWVGIVVGVLFIVGVVFFSGFVLGRSTGGQWGHHWRHGSMNECPMMQSGGMPMGPGGMMGPTAPSATPTPPFTQRP
jgi:hypothetical protein